MTQANANDRRLTLALDALETLKGEDVKTLDVTELTTITDYMVICTGRSGRHVIRLGEELIKSAKEAGLQPGVEGLKGGEWALIDLGGVVVHIMQPVTRAHYQLEKLWDISAQPEQIQAD
ncbi:MAG: ribosome silencing factor [Salinisphaeraceae bacterium]|jgi:ribosome-associated protein|nr:ribosome silencing factor [Salinisphaeraceae bacterium]